VSVSTQWGMAEELLVVDLDLDVASSSHRHPGSPVVMVGTTHRDLTRGDDRLLSQMDVVLSSVESPDHDPRVVVADIPAAVEAIAATVSQCPIAALCLVGLLRSPPSLLAESFAYSTLLAGPEFARWLADRPPVRSHGGVGSVVRVERCEEVLDVTLADPDRRNAFGRLMRHDLVEALGLLDVDDSITAVHLRGEGPAFCSGGDLAEFGTAPDPATAHLIRMASSPAALLQRHEEKVEAHVHGACIGAGVELPAFAGRVVARPDACFQLPELGMGLIPGAGGTVSLPRRIGRWRTAYMALTGAPVDAPTALAWHLVDEIHD
jgi:hypothetical protein